MVFKVVSEVEGELGRYVAGEGLPGVPRASDVTQRYVVANNSGVCIKDRSRVTSCS